MNKLSRRFRQLFSKSSRQSRLYRSSRRLRAEQLEGRLLLAGDLLHNDLTPSDVDNDGYVAPIDVLLVINALSQDGAAGEGDTAERPVYLDTNGDGELSPIDVLVPINDLLSGAGEGGDIVSYQPVALATSFVSRPAFGGFRYVENGANDSIVIIGNASWLDAGFAAGGQVLISDSGRFVDTFENPPVPDNQRNFDPDLRIHNNGLYDVISVTADTLTVQGNLITEYPSNVRSTDDSGAPLAGQEVSDSSAFFFRPLDSVSASQTFILAMLVEDLRTMTESGATLPDGSKGVFSATVDVTFDPAAVTPNGSSLSDLRFHNGYTGAASGSFSTPGLLDEAGASAFGGQVGVPTGAREQLLWRTPFTAGTSTADIVFATDPADLSPAHDTLVFGINTAIPPNMIEYQTLSLDIVSDIVANDDLANGQPILTV
ncbi:MAG: dockerin type I domain-containing protein, partial [Pirellulaceae bacterium]